MKLQKAKANILQLGVFVSVIVVGLAAFAENAYLAANDASGTTSLTNCANWRIGSVSGSSLGTAADPIKSGYGYIVPSGKALRSPTVDTTFGGDSLTIEGTFSLHAGAEGCEYTFPDGGLTIKGILYSWGGNNPVVKGKVTIPANATAHVSDSRVNSSIRFDCTFLGAETSTLWAHGYQNDRTCKIRFVDDALKDYSGQIACCTRTYVNRNGEPWPAAGVTLSSGTVTSPARVTIYPYCTMTAESAGDVVSVAELVMKTNSTISVVYDKSSKTASCIKVSGTFTHDEGPVKIAFEPNPTLGSWAGEEVPELPILKAPSGVTLSTNDFVLVTSAQFPIYELYVKATDDGLSTLCVHQVGKVITQSGEGNSSSDSSFVAGGYWSDGQLPNSSNCYYSTVGEQRAFGVFPGLVLARQSGYLYLKTQTVRIDDFRIIGTRANEYGVRIYANYGAPNEMSLEGRLRLMSENNYASLYGNGQTLVVSSEIDGPGKLRIVYKASATSSLSAVKLLAVNDSFAGKIDSECSDASDEKYNVLQFADGRSLGGAMPSWTYDGHKFNAYTHFVPLASTTLERENCGIYVADYARIVCNEGITLTVKERVTWNGEIKKLGAGTLAWGGEAPYFTTNGGTTPVANKNKLVVAEGALRAASSEAFRGVAVTVADGATLAVDVQADTESDLARYGMDLRPSGSSLAIEASSIRPVVSVPAGMQKPKQAAICTVSAEAAAALRGKFGVPVASSRAYGQPVVFERANDDGSVTFGIEFQRGFRIIFR